MREAITCTNGDLLSIEPSGTNFGGNLNQNTKFFIDENAFENVVCQMAVI